MPKLNRLEASKLNRLEASTLTRLFNQVYRQELVEAEWQVPDGGCMASKMPED